MFFGLVDPFTPATIMLAVIVGLMLHIPDVSAPSGIILGAVRDLRALHGRIGRHQLTSIFAGALAPILAVNSWAMSTNETRWPYRST